MNVEQFAPELKLPPQLLLEQLKAAGVSKQDAADAVTEADKAHLLDYLRKMHGGGAETGKTKITITRKQTGEIRKTDSTGKSRTIQVEVRKKRTYVKREVGAVAEAPLVEEVAAPVPAAPAVEEVAPPQAEPVVEAVVAAPVAEPVAEAPVAEPVEAAPVEAAPAEATTETAPVVKKTTRVKKASILNEAEIKSREDEARRHQALIERQTEEIRLKQERETLRKQDEAAR
jgi:translation initiation factor IF-2